MENKKMTFKTNLNCGGCVAKVQNDFDNTKNISKWNVDTENPNKILTVEGEIVPQEVMDMVKSKGFEIEQLNND